MPPMPKLATQPAEPSAWEMRLDQPAELGRRLLVAAKALGDQGAIHPDFLEALDDVRRDALGLELLPALPDVLQQIVQTGRRIGGVAFPGLFDSH
jgi:hypothetical protein